MHPSKSAQTAEPTPKLWTYAEAGKSLPYVRSLLRSIREHALNANLHSLELERLKARPGRPTRSDLLTEARLQQDAAHELDELVGTAEELEDLGVACLDPVQAEAAFPFFYNEQVAWFHHSLFDPPRQLTWRLDSDPLATRRPMVARIRDAETRKAG